MSDERTFRSLNSLGVSGLLEEDCKVYYSNLFSTHHLGRVSDLICARLRGVAPDELKLRAILLFGFFQAYRSHLETVGGTSLVEPMVIECGMDETYLAIGMTFRMGAAFDPEGLAGRISGGEPKDVFEELLGRIFENSTDLVLRIQTGVQLEVVSLVELSGAEERASEPRVVVLGEGEESAEAPVASEYVELGDLDYAALLSKDIPGRLHQDPPTGEFLAEGCTELEEAIRLRARAAAIESRFKVEGRREDLGEDVYRVKGAGTDLVDQSTVRISGDSLGEENSSDREALGGFLKKVWPFKKTADSDEVDEISSELVVTAPLRSEESVEDEAEIVLSRKPRKTATSGSEGETDPGELVAEIGTHVFGATLERAQEEFREIKEEVSSTKARRWMDGLMGDLVQEKAKLAEFARKLNLSIRQKELDFKNKEVAFHEELRKRDETVRQRTAALNRAKDQVSLLTTSLEKAKGSSQDKSEDAMFKQKYTLSQKLLLATKDENSKLHARIEDMKGQLASAQMGLRSRNSNAPSQTEFSALKIKNERSTRQAEELRNMNEQLSNRIDQLNERLQEKSASGGSDSSKKLEMAMKQVAAAQRDTEQMKLRVEELEREESRLKMELKRSQLELKTAKTIIARGGKVA